MNTSDTEGLTYEQKLGVAAQRFYEASGLNLSHTAKPEVVKGLRAALAVFEKAHTPTDDEREALARRALRAADEADECGDPVIEAWSDGERFTSDDLRTLAAGFRRSEVLEPKCEHGTSLAELCEYVERLANAEPQGEPSECGATPDEWLDHAECYPCERPKAQSGDHTSAEMTWTQGDLSDTLNLVIHAERVGTERDDPLILELAETMRAALRAAGGAR